MKRIEELFERTLWGSRLVVLVAVIASFLVALLMFYVATADSVMLVYRAVGYAAIHDEAVHKTLHAFILATIAEIVDGYLFATILIIFALGLYELFISKIDAAERSNLASGILVIRTLDDLKERLAKVVFLILIVRYFEYALQAPIDTPLDLLYLAIGIALIALSLYLSGKHAS